MCARTISGLRMSAAVMGDPLLVASYSPALLADPQEQIPASPSRIDDGSICGKGSPQRELGGGSGTTTLDGRKPS